MKKTLIAAALAVLSMSGIVKAENIITKTSPYSVAQTNDNLAAAVEGAGARVFARVDHAAGAASVDMELRPTQTLLFGNPKLGMPAMQASQTIGLDLPLRVLAYQAEDGSVVVTYQDPAAMAKAHGADADAKVFKMMTGPLNKLTDKAISE